ncbi:hypothetical protein [Microbispora sp. NPDC049125]|uniref:hypothetical protein n=1 Tax=Microbispora sp. NPDC049125 TaxID=3154929 RepID=UPI003466F167
MATIGIDRAPADVGDYLGEVPNLPAWTRFFRRVSPIPGRDHYEVETVMGTIETWIEASGEPGGPLIRSITSLIGGRREQAVLRLSPELGGSATSVEFTVRLPAGTPPDRAAGQRTAMTEELRRLKGLLEQVG